MQDLYKVITRDEAIERFHTEVLPHCSDRFEQDGEPDYPARCESWNNWTDMLCKAGEISDWQYDRWTHPDCCLTPSEIACATAATYAAQVPLPKPGELGFVEPQTKYEKARAGDKPKFRLVLRKKDGVDYWIIEEETMDSDGRVTITNNYLEKDRGFLQCRDAVNDLIEYCDDLKVENYPLAANIDSLVSEWVYI